jgi:CheY-like chemotaxis protein
MNRGFAIATLGNHSPDAIAMSTPADSAPFAPRGDFELHWPGVALCEPDTLLRALLGEWLRRAELEPLRCVAGGSLTPVVLVVADIPTPRRNGAEYIASLRARFADAKFLAISGQFMPGLQGAPGAATTLGADAVLAKPFSSSMFIDTVRALLQDWLADPLRVRSRGCAPRRP